MEKPNYYAILPAEVRYCKELSPMERLLYAEITCLCNHKGYCWATNNYFKLQLVGYDSRGGTSGATIVIDKRDMIIGETFVWNDKFSFNGCEPTNFTGPMDDATKQNAIADQGEDTKPQKLQIVTEDAQDAAHIHITYIDQNNE